MLAYSRFALAFSRSRASSAPALDYPNKPVHFIVCFAAGGPNDITARLFSQYLSEHFGQQFIIENRLGAGGNIGMQAALTFARRRLHHRLCRPEQLHQCHDLREAAV